VSEKMTNLRTDLENICGSTRVYDDEQTLDTYSSDQSFVAPRRPDCVVYAESAAEVLQIIRLANQNKFPVISFSSGLNFHGATIPDHGGVIVDLSRMHQILHFDVENWYAIVEPGVTYEQLQDHALSRGFRVMIPFGAAPRRSVLSSYLERDPVLAASSFEYGNFLIMDMEIILPTGEMFRTGQWSSGGEPGGPMGPVRNSLFRLWTGAQGTLGVVTKMGVQITPHREQQAVYFIYFDDLAEALEPLQLIQRREIGMECFLLNRFNCAALLSAEWRIPEAFPAQPQYSKSFEQLKKTLPAWIMVICIRGGVVKPDQKIAYEVEALKETCSLLNCVAEDSFLFAAGAHRIIMNELLRPFSILKKFNFRGSVHDLNFKSPLRRIADMENIIKSACDIGGYDTAHIGGYILPLERGRAIHCEFDLHSNPADLAETAQVRRIWMQASEALMRAGAFFDRPYGVWAPMVYQRSGVYTEKLKEIKRELDPHNILNPGKLCFQ
jgi:hypothetical protein